MTTRWGETDVAFDYVALHDALIERVDIEGTRVVLSVDFVRLRSEHPANVLGETAIATGASLVLDDVVASIGRRFDDANHQWVELPSPLEFVAGTSLIDCAEHRRDDGLRLYEFEGFQPRTGIALEWTVTARGFALRWNSPMRKWRT